MWFAPKDILFHREHIIWLLKHLKELKVGEWPPDPGVTGYTEAPGGVVTSRAKNAHYEIACSCAAEVSIRLKATGLDGYLVEERYMEDKTEQEISDTRHLPLTEVYQRLRTAINYMSGWRRRQYSYSDFKRHRRTRVAG